MKKIFEISKWEFLEKIKTRAFVLSLIITPALVIIISIGGTFLSTTEEETTRVVGILDSSMVYYYPLLHALENYRLENGQPAYIVFNLNQPGKSIRENIKSADVEVIEDRIAGYVLLERFKNDSLAVEYRSQNAGNFKDIQMIENAVEEVRIRIGLSRIGVNPDLIKSSLNKIQVSEVTIKKGNKAHKSDFLTEFLSSIIFIMLLLMMIIYSGQMLVRSLVEEKSNRLIEILISSCSPEELLAGKILGLSALGLFQMFIWACIGIALAGSSVIPSSAFNNISIMLVYFILGFLFYTALFVGIGSIVTTEQEAQLLTSYLSLILVLPIAISAFAITNPNSVFVQVLSFIPFTIPSVMLLKINIINVPVPEIVSTVIIMVLSIYFTILVASKIFRIGILSYGRKPSLKELISWIKER
jgi:ABC-2 type transport system permease protein